MPPELVTERDSVEQCPVNVRDAPAAVIEMYHDLGRPPPAGLQGSPWGTGRDYALSEIFSRYRNHPKFHRELFAVRMDGYKYIRSTTGEEELYDVTADPRETRNLIGPCRRSSSEQGQVRDGATRG